MLQKNQVLEKWCNILTIIITKVKNLVNSLTQKLLSMQMITWDSIVVVQENSVGTFIK